MYASQTTPLEFAESRAAEALWTLSAFSRFDSADAADHLATVDAADRSLLRLVLCAAAATLLLSLAMGMLS